MERCQAHHAGQQGPDYYTDKQILGCLQLSSQLGSGTHSQESLARGGRGLIPGTDGSPSYSEHSRGEAQELKRKNRVKTGLGQVLLSSLLGNYLNTKFQS